MKFYTNVEKVGSKIICRGYDNGKRFLEKDNFEPSLFVKTTENTKYKNIYGEPLKEIKFKGISDAYQFLERHGDVSNAKIFGMEKWVTQYISQKYWNEIKYDSNLIRVCWIDIETDTKKTDKGKYANPDDPFQPITAVTLVMGDEIIVLGYGDFKPKSPNIKYYKQKDEAALIDSLIEFIAAYKPDIISGWNSELYDIPYIIKRGVMILGEERVKDLSPYKIIKQKTIPTMNGGNTDGYDIYGIAHLDYMLVYKKLSGKSQSSYRLNHIAEVEIGMQKIDYKKDYGSLEALMEKNYQLYMEYNIRDTQLLPLLEKKLKLLELIYLISYYSKTNYMDVFKNTRIWDSLIYNYLIAQNIVVDIGFESDDKRIEGGHVKDPIPGLYDWVVTVDATSLYPHIIISQNISPEKFVKKVDFKIDNFISNYENGYENGLFGAKSIKTDDLKTMNCGICGNGSIFKNDSKGFLPIMMENLFNMRKEYKKKMLEAEVECQKYKEGTPERNIHENNKSYFNNYQNVIKILLNSGFGAMAAKGFRYKHSNFGEAITLQGQTILKWGEMKLNRTLNSLVGTKGVDYVIYCDTDSIMFRMDDVLKKLAPNLKTDIEKVDFIQKFFNEKLSPKFSDYYNELTSLQNGFEQKIHFKLEKICNRGIFLSKKRYILSVWDKEGTRYKEPVVSVTGVESVRSTTPLPVRAALKTIFNIFLNGTNDMVLDYIDKFREEYYKLRPDEISIPQSVNNITQYMDRDTLFKKATPIHVRAAILYNNQIDVKDLSYEKIQDGEKAQYVYLKMPNPYFQNVMGFLQEIPSELNLDEYVDYKLMFDKSFLSALENIFEATKWKANRNATLEDFF